MDDEDTYVKVFNNFKDLPNFLKKAKQSDLHIKNKRPFVIVSLNKDKVKGDYELLIDTGNGDALWVLNEIDKDVIFKNSFEDYLGFGTHGKIYGRRTKVDSIKIFNSTLKKAAVSYPFKEYRSIKKTKTSHDGSLGGEMLRRFNVVIDYPNRKIIMLPNKAFDEGFYCNMSGLGVQKGELELFSEIDRDIYKNNYNNGYSTKTDISAASSFTISTISKLVKHYVSKIYVELCA